MQVRRCVSNGKQITILMLTVRSFTWMMLSAQLCTEWDTPDAEAGMAAFGGLVTTRGENNVPVKCREPILLAYTQGGEVLQTRSIHDGTYHFYNVEPGTYLIFADAWVSGQLRTVTASVTVGCRRD